MDDEYGLVDEIAWLKLYEPVIYKRYLCRENVQNGARKREAGYKCIQSIISWLNLFSVKKIKNDFLPKEYL